MKKQSVKLVVMLLVLLVVLSGCGHNTPESGNNSGSEVGGATLDGDKGQSSGGSEVGSGENAVSGTEYSATQQPNGAGAGENGASGDDNAGVVVCAYCAETGHTADSCAVKAADEAPCSYCKETGHKVDSCAKKIADETVCSNCGEKGHKLAACPNKVCSYCKLTGHLVDDCSSKKFDETYCTYCGVRGHKENKCPKKKEHNSFCAYCNMDGHSIDNCLDRIVAEDICTLCGLSGKVHDKSACEATPCTYCKETGHWVDDCILKINDDRNYCAYCKVYGHKRSTCEKEAADFAAFDVNYWVQYAKDYAVSIGLTLDSTMTKENSSWDNPIIASYRGKYIAENVQSRMNEYKRYIEKYGTAGVVWVEALPDGPYEWDLMIYYG